MIDHTLAEAYGALTAEQVATLDGAAAGRGVSVVQLMEIAGWQVARWLLGMFGTETQPLLVVAGHGNNGGDGMVAARHLRTWGLPVRLVVVASPERLGEVVAAQLNAARGAGVEVGFAADGEVEIGPGIVVDALLGTGARGDPRGPPARAIERLPADRTVAIDIPSGLDATTGVVGAPAVLALATCTLTAMKAGLWAASARRHTGPITVADIGMPATAWAAAGLHPPGLIRGGELLLVPTDTHG
jgi:hydroxyethylthiazole kinase-like uncharacterized protein yjeF